MEDEAFRLLVLFLDGVGIGSASPDENPFFRTELPALRGLLGALPSDRDPVQATATATSFPVDATLGVDGLPQSGTGQATLLTGLNGPARLGRHFGPWTPTLLRPAVEQENVLRRALEAGLDTAFANAVPPRYTESRWFRRPAPVPLAAHTAGLLTRDWKDVAAGNGMANSIVNGVIRERWPEAGVPEISSAEAGINLARIASRHDLTFFAHYATDTAGHAGDADLAVAALELVDGLISGVLSARTPQTGILVVSDHGNIESLEEGHTRNPVLGLWIPPQTGTSDVVRPPAITTLEHVAPWILGILTSDKGERDASIQSKTLPTY